MKSLSEFDLPWKLLITFFLIVLSSGFLVAELYLMHTTEMFDGKSGLSMHDITIQFHGDEKGSRLKSMVLGPMKKYFSENNDDKNLKAEEQADLDRVIKWLDDKAPEKEFWLPPDPGETEHKSGEILKIFNMRGCLDCHARDAMMDGNKKDSPLEKYADVAKFTVPDKGMDTGRLLMLSHVHLLGMGMMFLLVGAALAMTRWHRWLKCFLIVGGLGSILLDIFGWWGVKWYGAAISPVVFFGGALMGVCFGLSVLCSLYDLWLRKNVPPVAGEGPVLIQPSGSAVKIK